MLLKINLMQFILNLTAELFKVIRLFIYFLASCVLFLFFTKCIQEAEFMNEKADRRELSEGPTPPLLFTWT